MKTKLLSILAVAILVINAIAVPLNYYSSTNQEHCGVATEQNRRPYQEDRYTRAPIRDIHGKKIGQFFAVYDGHGGDKVSSLLKKKLHKKFADQLYKGKSEKKAFEKALSRIEQEALENYSDGSTVVAAYLDYPTKMVHFINVGDSRLLVQNGPATEDQKPDNPQEKKRIEDAGGKVEFYGVARVKGLAVARSIGDRSIKKVGKGQVIATPEYGQYQLTQDNAFMILASDGIWDKIDNENATMLIKNALSYGHSCKTAAHLLKDEAIKRGSGDNITVMVVQFDWK